MRDALTLLTALAFSALAAAVILNIVSISAVTSREIAAACEPPAAPYVPVFDDRDGTRKWAAAHPGMNGPIVCAPHNGKQPSLAAWAIALGR